MSGKRFVILLLALALLLASGCGRLEFTLHTGQTQEALQTITVNGPDRTYIETIRVPKQITGYEYQFEACRQALIDGLLEPKEMPHEETLYVMELMDALREKWGVRYPMDEE